jgi:3-methyladenine DNA glycosylase AlkD
MGSKLLSQIRAGLAHVADPKKAPQMQAYMKSAMPYHGVPVPLTRKVCRHIFSELRFPTAKSWRSEVLEVWHGARFREERYAAIILTGHREAVKYQEPSSLDLYEELIVTGAWWDYVDDIAIHRVGPMVGEYPQAMKRKMLAYSKSNDTWKRRTSILCQIMLKEKTDLALLYGCIEPSLDSEEFFLRKAIGWALREVAWTDADEVIRYIRKHEDRLSALTKREALKNILRSDRPP